MLHRQQRWIALHNVGPDEIPPYGIVEVVQGVRPEQGIALTPDGGPTVAQVRKPQTDCGSAFLINGPLPIPVRGYGQPGTNDYPCYVRYNPADGTPTPNDMWGTAKDSYAIGRGRQGLAIVGDADTVDGVPLVRVMRSERLIRVTPFGDGAVMFPGQPTRCYVMRHNGTFWDVVGKEDKQLSFDLSDETLKSTNLGTLKPGDRVNLEPALRPDSKIGGHFVTGHVDAVGKIRSRVEAGDMWKFEIEAPPEVMRFTVEKGSIAVDGISLTIVDILKNAFSLVIIPHTAGLTTLGFKVPGDAVNIETDILGKYVAKFLQKQPDRDAAFMKTLTEGGFGKIGSREKGT